jgi:hypothetical protein
MSADRPMSERLAAFANRASWNDPLGTVDYVHQINNMVAHFDHLGVVEVMPGPTDGEDFPEVIEVEDRRKLIRDVMSERARPKRLGSAAQAGRVHAGAPGTSRAADISGAEKFHRFPSGLPVKFG